MSVEVDAMIKEGIRLYKAGKKAEARANWEQVTELDQLNEQAWLWLSAVVESVDDQRTCLENVLYINPNNTNAKKGLETLESKSGIKQPAQSAPTPAVTPEPPQSAAKSYEAPPPTATSSASSVYVPDEPAPEIYDDWIGSLNLSGKPAPIPSAAPFTVEDFDDDSFADDSFDDFSFDEDEPAPAAKSAPRHQTDNLRAAFLDDDDDDDVNFDDPFDDPFADDPFADEPSMTSGPFSAAALELDEDDEVVDARALRGIQPAPSRTYQTPAPRSPSSPPPPNYANTNASRYFVGDNAKSLDEPDPSEYFASIPERIKATRLPGTDEKYPLLVRVGLILLLLLNIGAAALLVFQLVG